MAKLNWDRASEWRKTRNGVHNGQRTQKPKTNPTIQRGGTYDGWPIRKLPQQYLEWALLNWSEHKQWDKWANEWLRRHEST